MSKLKEKSDFNLKSAKLLIDKNYFSSSVHCSYYSCFQLLKYIMKYFNGVSYSQLTIDIRQSPKKNSHGYVIQYITDQLIDFSNDKSEALKIRHKIKDLKLFREESDYDDLEIKYQKSISAYNSAEEIRQYLVKNYNL